MAETDPSARRLNLILGIVVIAVLAFLAWSVGRYRRNAAAPTTPAAESSETALTTTEDPNARPATEEELGTTVEYAGETGRTAFDLLMEQADRVGYQDSELGQLVTSINGLTAPDGYFWSYYINDQAAQVGASSYVTQDNDLIRWQLDSLNAQ